MEANQTLDALETLMAMENLPKLSNFFVAGWYSGIGEFCKVLDSLHRLESHITERDSTLRYHAFAENAPPEPFPGYAVARFESRLHITEMTGHIDRSFSVAQNETRTHTPLLELGPEPSASTNSAIWALQKMQQGKYRPKVALMSITVTYAQKPFIIQRESAMI